MKTVRWMTMALVVFFLTTWGQTVHAGFVNNGNGTVTDTSTGLIWQQDTARDEQGNYDVMDWEEALAYCEALVLGGHTDWRLPTIKELGSLVDLSRYDPAINTVYFPDTKSSYYRSSTTDVEHFSPNDARRKYAWIVSFSNGSDVSDVRKSDPFYVRAVRGGQSGSFDYSIIATAGAGGAISPSGTVGVNSGGSVTFNITADSEYQILDIKVDDTSQGAISTYTFSNVTGVHTITASFYFNGTTGMPIGTILYRTSDSNEMPGRVGSPTGGELNFPYLQIPCLIYCGLLYSEGWSANSEKTRDLLENCTEEEKPFPPTRTGHVAVYIGQIDGENKIIEAGGNYTDGGLLVDIPEILIAPLNTFVDEEKGQVFIGAKFPTGTDVHGRSLPDNCQTNIVGLAKEHKEEGYDLDFNRQKGETEGDWICVGFAEKLYESCNLEPKEIGEMPLTFFDPYPYGENGEEVYGGYDITKDGFYNEEAIGGLTRRYSYDAENGYFRRCDEVCADTISFHAYATFSNDKEFSQVRHPRNDENDTTCGKNFRVGRESNGKYHIFWPYTQFKQDTLQSVRTTLDVGTTVINIVGGPSRENPVTVFPECGKTIEIEVEVLDRNGKKVSNLTADNFIVSLEKNEDGRCVAMACGYNEETNEIYFSSVKIPFTRIGCGTYEIRVDYRDNEGNIRSSYSRDNALVVSNIGEEATVKNYNFFPGTTSEYVATKILSIAGGIYIPKGAKVTFRAPKVKVQSQFNVETGAFVDIKQN